MPSEMLRPGQAARRLSGIERRAELIAAGGRRRAARDRVHARALAALAGGLRRAGARGAAGAVHVVVGENYRFGHAAVGDAATLEALGEKLGFGVTAVSLVTADGERVSSSWIRELVRQGEVDACRAPARPRRPGSTAPSCAASRAAARSASRPRTCAGRPGASCPAPGVYAGFGVLGPGEERYPGGDLGRRQPDVRRRRGHGRRGVPDRLRRRRLRPADARRVHALPAPRAGVRGWRSSSSRCGATSRPRAGRGAHGGRTGIGVTPGCPSLGGPARRGASDARRAQRCARCRRAGDPCQLSSFDSSRSAR